MENQKDPLLNREDALKAENNLLKLKLGLQHGILMDDNPALAPELENQWLKSVYTFEQQYKNTKRVKLYDFLGRPSFKKWDTLSPEQASAELRRMDSLMSQHGVELDRICKYDDAVIYRFITEELFEHETDDMHMPGMTTHYIYEEFYPNHDYDLRQQSHDFVKAIFTRAWNEEFDGILLAPKILFSGKEHDRASISSIIRVFQAEHEPLHIETFNISEVVIDAERSKAQVRACISLSGTMKNGRNIWYEDTCSFYFEIDDHYWFIAEFAFQDLQWKRNRRDSLGTLTW